MYLWRRSLAGSIGAGAHHRHRFGVPKDLYNVFVVVIVVVHVFSLFPAKPVSVSRQKRRRLLARHATSYSRPSLSPYTHRLLRRWIELLVESFLADLDGITRFIENFIGHFLNGHIERIFADHAVHKSDLERFLGRGGSPRSASPSLASGHIAAEGHHRCGAEEADMDARCGEMRRVHGDRKIASRDQLAARRRRYTLTRAMTGCGSCMMLVIRPHARKSWS